MTLIQKNIGNAAYYTDGVNYFTFHLVNKNDALWTFACMDLGITKRSGFTTEETAKINDLAGTGMQQKTKYLLLKNSQTAQVPYHITGAPKIHPGDVILRRVSPPAVGTIK